MGLDRKLRLPFLAVKRAVHKKARQVVDGHAERQSCRFGFPRLTTLACDSQEKHSSFNEQKYVDLTSTLTTSVSRAATHRGKNAPNGSCERQILSFLSERPQSLEKELTTRNDLECLS